MLGTVYSCSRSVQSNTWFGKLKVLGNLGMTMEQNWENDAEELRMMERMMENNEVLESAWKPGLGGRVSWRSAVRVSWEAFVHLRGAAVNISGPPIDGSFTGESGESDDMWWSTIGIHRILGSTLFFGQHCTMRVHFVVPEPHVRITSGTIDMPFLRPCV